MDAKDIKTWLKEARVAFKGKDYNQSVLLSKKVLKVESNNYTALVCLGAALNALGKGQQCVEAYKAAIQISSSQIPAWQGLVKHYEDAGVKSNPDLIEAYKKIAAFYEKDSDEGKYIENTMKFAGALVYQDQHQKALKVLMRLGKKMRLPVNVATLVVQIVGNLKGVVLTDEEEQLLVDALDTLTKYPETQKDEYFKTFYSLLYKRNEIVRLIEECMSVPKMYNSIYYPMEYLCRVYVENHPEVDFGNEISALADKLFKLHPSSVFGYFAKGKYCYEFGNVTESVRWLKEGLESRFNKHAYVVFIQAKLKLGDDKGALESVKELRKNAKQTDMDIEFQTLIQTLEIESLIGVDSAAAEESLIQLEAMDSKSALSTVTKLRSRICFWKMDWPGLKDATDNSEDNNELTFYKMLVSDADVSVPDKLLEYSNSEDVEEDLLIVTGRMFWKMGMLPEAANTFSKVLSITAVLNITKNHPLPLIHLGKLHLLEEEIVTAIKFFEVAYDLYPCNDTGCILSDAYFKGGLEFEVKNKELLTAATKRLKKLNSKWAWLRLGLLYLQTGNAHEATVALQSAVRTDYNDGDIWETLADAYFARGSFHSALKSYNKALELNVDPIYSSYKIGIIYQQLNENNEAIKTFESLIAKDPTYTPAFIELSKTHYKVAQNYFSERRDRSGVVAVEQCLRWTTMCLQLDSKVLPWKIMGDCTMLMAELPLGTSINVPSLLVAGEKDGSLVSVELMQFLKIGTDCFHMALKTCRETGLLSAQSDLYHDLGNNYRMRAMRTSDEQMQLKLLKKALAAVKIAVSNKKTSHIFWNTLGVIASHTALNLVSLAQHAFIKSLQLEPNNVVAWCNLGLLQYHSENYLNAHRCFSKAQAVDPSYSFCWVGQCVVAEQLRPQESIDLFRHSCLLDNFPDVAVLGYTDWVCRLLASGNETEENYVYSIIKCEAVRTSFDLITFYCGRHPENIFGFLYRGILAARLELLQTSKDCFEKALDLLQKNQSQMTDIIKCNLAATLLNMGEIDKAFSFLQDVEDADFNVCCIAAQAFDTVKNYDMCIHAYEQAVEKAADDNLKAEALIGLGIVHGKSTGLEEAKTYIFQAWRLARAKITGLLAIVALSLQKEELTNADRAIARAVYEEIQPITEYDLLNDVTTISCAWFLSEGNIDSAKNCILRAIRRYPWNPTLWSTLAHFLIECHGKDPIVRPLIRKSVARINVWERTSELLISLSYLLECNVPQGLLYAKKAVHCEPYSPSSWAVLILALHRTKPSLQTLRYTAHLAEKALKLCSDPNASVTLWLQDYIGYVVQFL